MKKLIIFLIRTRLGLKKGERFRFTNQKTKDIYFFNDTELMKFSNTTKWYVKSGASLNWLLDDNCRIERVDLKEE